MESKGNENLVAVPPITKYSLLTVGNTTYKTVVVVLFFCHSAQGRPSDGEFRLVNHLMRNYQWEKQILLTQNRTKRVIVTFDMAFSQLVDLVSNSILFLTSFKIVKIQMWEFSLASMWEKLYRKVLLCSSFPLSGRIHIHRIEMSNHLRSCAIQSTAT